jgi:hypothetical protein
MVEERDRLHVVDQRIDNNSLTREKLDMTKRRARGGRTRSTESTVRLRGHESDSVSNRSLVVKTVPSVEIQSRLR